MTRVMTRVTFAGVYVLVMTVSFICGSVWSVQIRGFLAELFMPIVGR